MDRRRRKAFTLIELLIVITILAIIAAIAVPKFLDASEDARESALATNLQMLRRQIALYRLQHGDRGPHLDENDNEDTRNIVARMTGRTDANGKIIETGAFGPYMKEWPSNPFCDAAIAQEVTAGAASIYVRDGSSGWYYCTTTCLISANSTIGAERCELLE